MSKLNTEISVVSATYNRLPLLKKLLTALEAQTMPRESFEVIIVDDGSTDGTCEFLSEYEATHSDWFKYAINCRKGPGAARNRGWRLSSAPIIAFTDDDTVPMIDWVAEIREAFINFPDHCGIGGEIKRINDSYFSRFYDASGCLGHPRRGDGEVVYLVTANASYRREALETVHGFREDITWPGGEDPDLSSRITAAGHRLEKWGSAIVHHHHRDSTVGIFKTFRNYGRGFGANDQRRDFSLRSNYRFYRMLGRQFRTVVKRGESMAERIVFVYCGLVRAVGFAWGYHAYRRETKNVPSGNSRVAVSNEI